MRKTALYSIGASLAILLLVGGSAIQTKAGQEEDWHCRVNSGDNLPRHTPVIVAERNYKEQTESIPETTLFTPDCSGMFRISVYNDQPNLTNTGDLGPLTQTPYITWTDDYAQNQSVVLTGSGTEPVEVGKPAYYTHQIVVHSDARQPIQFNMLEQTQDHSAYNVYVVVEEL